MKKSLLLLTISIGVLYACQPDNTLSSSEKTEDELTEEVQDFFSSVSEKNGVHLYNDEQNNSVLVYLNGYHVDQGDAAVGFNDFEVEADGNQLHLSYQTNTTMDYLADIKNQQFYEVSLDQAYDEIRLFNDGEEVAFHTISGNLE